MDNRVLNTFSHVIVGEGRATLAIRVTGEQLEVGVAFCSPKDQFSKVRGRKLAAGRLEAHRGFYASAKRDPNVRLKQQAQSLVEDLAKNGGLVVQPNAEVANHKHRVPEWANR